MGTKKKKKDLRKKQTQQRLSEKGRKYPPGTLMVDRQCNDPDHAEPYACHQRAEGGFVCKDTYTLELIVAGVKEARTIGAARKVLEDAGV